MRATLHEKRDADADGRIARRFRLRPRSGPTPPWIPDRETAAMDARNLSFALLRRHRSRIFALASIALFASASATAAPTFVVDTPLDGADDAPGDGFCHTADNFCTLRAALMEANAGSDGATILLDARTYSVSLLADSDDSEATGDLDVTTSAPVRIIGEGRNRSFIDGGTGNRVLHVHPGADLTVIGAELTGGWALSGFGGCVWNEGTVLLQRTIVTFCAAGEGGAIYNAGTATIDRSLVSRSGGIRNRATLVVTDSTIDSNNGSPGGGIWSEDGDATPASVRLVRSTVSNNAGGAGGFCCSGDLVVVDATFSNNYGNAGAGGITFGAGATRTGTASLYNATIAFNSTNTAGGGIGVTLPAGSALRIENSIVARNTRADGTTADDCAGRVDAEGSNIVNTSGACLISGEGTWVPLLPPGTLGALADNGGPTETAALFAGSNAIDGAAGGCLDDTGAPIDVDQRGFARDGACDIGAYEFGGVDIDTLFIDGFDGAP
jgi:hypothetical protein